MTIKYITCVCLILLSTRLSARDTAIVYINNTFFAALVKQKPITRDQFLRSHLNKVVLCRGVVKKIEKINRYKKRYRATIIDQSAQKKGILITYYAYIDKKDSVQLLTNNTIFEFSGQFVSFTPVNSERNSYILDILLEKGAMLIE